MSKHSCPDCGGEYESGFVLDFGHSGPKRQVWQRGNPEDATFLGMKISPGVVKPSPEKMLPITTFRCTQCGLLKFYAVPE